MKTVEELAKEYISNRFSKLSAINYYGDIAEQGFLAGYTKAKQWISVDDDLPEYKIGDNYPIAVKINNEIRFIWVNSRFTNEILYKNKVTHWKYID